MNKYFNIACIQEFKRIFTTKGTTSNFHDYFKMYMGGGEL